MIKFEQKTYFKLCRQSLYPTSSIFASGEFRLSYSLNNVTRPVPGSVGILVFDTYENLVNSRIYYEGENEGFIIFKCLVKGPVLPVKRLLIFDTEFRYFIYKGINRAKRLQRLAAEEDKHKLLVRTTANVPHGTFSVNLVKPIEQLQ